MRFAPITAGVLAALALSALVPAAPAHAQAFPSRQVTFVVPFPPGGSTDRVTRLIAQKFSEAVGQPAVVENRPGATGAPAAQSVLNATQDGHHIFVSHVGIVAMDPHLHAKMAYDPVKDFRPVTTFFTFQSALVVPASLPVKNVQELIALAKSKPGGLSYASQGVATTGHFFGEMLAQTTGAPMVHIPMKGAAQAVAETAAGRTDFLYSSYISSQAFLKDGRLKAIAYASDKRSPLLPDVPTLREAGISNLDFEQWFAFFVPAKVSDAAVRRLNEELVKAARTPEIVQSVQSQDTSIVTSSPEELARKIAAESQRYGDIIRRLKIKAD